MLEYEFVTTCINTAEVAEPMQLSSYPARKAHVVRDSVKMHSMDLSTFTRHSFSKSSERKKHTRCLTSYLDAVPVGCVHDSGNEVLGGLPVVISHPGRIPGQHQDP